MNKQELIEKIKNMHEVDAKNEYEYGEPYYSRDDYLKVIEQLDEPSRECEIVLEDNENGIYKGNPKEYYKCSQCDDCFPVDKTDIDYMSFINYCPNCGAKIKREKSDE
jgi:DNA-directed RNA polymerase subunit RPC12/RpoP